MPAAFRLLFCHGLGSTKGDARLVREWSRIRTRGAVQFQMMKYERYGDDGRVWTVDDWTRGIAAELGAACPRGEPPPPTIAVCVSAGAQALLRALWRSPQLVDRLSALLLVSPGVRMELPNYVRRVLPAHWDALRAGLAVEHPSADPSVRIRISIASLEDYAENCVLRRAAKCQHQFPKLHCPVRIVHGIHDKLVPFANSVELLERVPVGDKALHLVASGHVVSDTATVLHALDSLWARIGQNQNEKVIAEDTKAGEASNVGSDFCISKINV